MLYVINYDLRQPGRNYDALYKAIKGLGDHVRPLESLWIVDTALKATPICQRLRPMMDQNDYLFVTELGVDSDGWLPKTCWEWIAARNAKAWT